MYCIMLVVRVVLDLLQVDLLASLSRRMKNELP